MIVTLQDLHGKYSYIEIEDALLKNKFSIQYSGVIYDFVGYKELELIYKQVDFCHTDEESLTVDLIIS